jgi:hypothetical protein
MVASAYFYGTQPPILSTEENLYLVNDSDHMDMGPAWYFRAVYDKLVIVPENSLPPPTSDWRTKRRHDGKQRKSVAEAGDKPWFCYWNGTILETFIYVNIPNPSAQPIATSAIASGYGSGPVPTTYTLSSNPGPSAAMPTTGASAAAPSSGTENPVLPLEYPKQIRIEERRESKDQPGYVPPYCIQMYINSNGCAVPYMDGGNAPVEITLHEVEPVLHKTLRRSVVDGFGVHESELIGRQQEQSCDCVWQSQ